MEPRTVFSLIIAPAVLPSCLGQVLIDSIPFPDISQGFWGIHVTADTIFLGDDFSGAIYFSDHDGNILGQQTTPYGYDHGLIVRPQEFWIAEDYASNGALLQRVDHFGNAVGSWSFPDVIGGPSSGIGDICAEGDAIWYTMYYPDFDTYPYAYAYKWVPGDPAPIDTVPMNGEQPYGIALKGDTLLYVTDNLNGDAERIYAYDLINEQDLGYLDLPDMVTDGDQSPRGMFYDGEHLYLIANRQGGSAFAYQTIFIYAFNDLTFIKDATAGRPVELFPSPATDQVRLRGIAPGTAVRLHDEQGRVLRSYHAPGTTLTIALRGMPPGVRTVTCTSEDGRPISRRFVVSP